MTDSKRNSAHELLRIIAMFMIVWYHLMLYYLNMITHDGSLDYIYEALLPTLHIGVILFVLISGYYGIKASLSGFLKLFLVTMIYYLPIELFRSIYHHGDIISTLQFITNTPYWYVRTYLFLYIISPILNKYIVSSDRRSVDIMTIILGIIAIYFGSTNGDPSLVDGKNVVNFAFLYFLGNGIAYYKERWMKVSNWTLVSTWLMLNVFIFVSLLLVGKDSALGDLIWNISFPYCSPLLIINALLLFIGISKYQFYSKVINYIATSMFAVYLIHCQTAVHKYLILPLCEEIANYPPHVFAILFAASIGVVAICVLVDKLLNPLWQIEHKCSNYIQDSICKRI